MNKYKKINVSKTVDHFSGEPRKQPPNYVSQFKYDFYFRKVGTRKWRYLNSSNDLKAFAQQIITTAEHGGESIIVDSVTSEIL